MKGRLRNDFDLTEENLAYYSGENALANWIGPSTNERDPHFDEVWQAIAKVFQSRNITKECIDRHCNALVGLSPHWYFTDATGSRVESDAASIAELLLQRWLYRLQKLSISQENQITSPIRECTKNMLVAGVGYLRLWSPRRFLNSLDLVNRVCLHSPHPSSIVIDRDSDGFIKTITYTYIENNIQRKETQFISESGLTIFATLDESNKIIPDSEFALDLGGRYSIVELKSASLITDSIKRAQNAINYALTLLPHNLNAAGFRERLILGGQPPGTWDDDGKFIPDPEFRIGAGQTSFIQGTPINDETGNLRGYTTPNAVYQDPVPVNTFIDTAQAFIATIYHEMSQTHLLGSDLQLSGISREQARQDFETKLGEHADIVSAAISSTYGAALMMMAQDDIEPYRDLDVAVQLRLNATKPLPEEQDQLLKFQQAGLLSKATAMSLSGFVEDSDSELALLSDEEKQRTAVDDASSLLTIGAIDSIQAIDLLKRRGRLETDTITSNGERVSGGKIPPEISRNNEVLNGSQAS